LKTTWTPSWTRSIPVFALCAALSAVAAPPASGAESDTAAPAALAACETFAIAHYQRARPVELGSLRLLDEGVGESAAARTVGSQAVATTLTGRGVWRDKAAAATDVHFVCLLDTAGKPVFFELVEGDRRDPAAVCWDSFEPAGWGPLTDCLTQALQREETALEAALTAAREQAAQSMDKASATPALAESTARWIAYRDSECDRQLAFVAGRNHPDIGELTCRIRETAARIADLRFDE
jgi:uncharacterized protein YecT (DUF1311 family)